MSNGPVEEVPLDLKIDILGAAVTRMIEDQEFLLALVTTLATELVDEVTFFSCVDQAREHANHTSPDMSEAIKAIADKLRGGTNEDGPTS